MQSRLITRQTKSRLYKTLITLVLTYASQTWALSKDDEKDPFIIERKILHRIFGPEKDGIISSGEAGIIGSYMCYMLMPML